MATASGLSAAELDELAARAREGDRQAFADFVVATSPRVLALARRLVGNDHDAADVLQESYLHAFRAIGRYRGDAAATTWLYRITANCAANHLRRRRRCRHVDVEQALSIADPAAELRLIEAATGSSERRRLRQALDRLPDILRVVVVLRDVYDLPHEDIARHLGISRAAAKVRLHRGRKLLRELLPPVSGDCRLSTGPAGVAAGVSTGTGTETGVGTGSEGSREPGETARRPLRRRRVVAAGSEAAAADLGGGTTGMDGHAAAV